VATSTVYRNLGELADAGAVVRITAIGGGDRYELAEQISHHNHHHHLVCVDCGIVTDFDPSPQLERLIDREVASLLASSGFEVTNHVFDVRGRCRRCAGLGHAFSSSAGIGGHEEPWARSHPSVTNMSYCSIVSRLRRPRRETERPCHHRG
jgi:hypothetical protein